MRSWPVLAMLVLALTSVASACAASGTVGEATGLVTSVVGDDPASVARFTLRTSDGRETEFVVGDVELVAGSFAPAHLREHLASGEQVRVTWVRQDGAMIVTGLFDAR